MVFILPTKVTNYNNLISDNFYRQILSTISIKIQLPEKFID